MEWPTSHNHWAEDHHDLREYLINPPTFVQAPPATGLAPGFPSTLRTNPGITDRHARVNATQQPALVDGPNHPNPTAAAVVPPAWFDQSPLYARLPANPHPLLQSDMVHPGQQTLQNSHVPDQVPCSPNNPPHASSPFQCKWEGCCYPGSFNRPNDLMRHVRNMHVSRGAFPCRAGTCEEVFNRKDNLQEHMRRRHPPRG